MRPKIGLLAPRPNLRKIVEMVEQGFELSEASSTPVMLELRIRACHVQGSFKTKHTEAPSLSKRTLIENPAFDLDRICLPPATYAQEKHKIDVRCPAAVRFIRERKLNETFAGDMRDLGILCQGGLYNAVIRALQQLGFDDAFGASRVPIYCMNVTYPLIPEEITEFCRDKASVLVDEEGQPAYIEEAALATLRRHEVNAVRVHGKDLLPMAEEDTGDVDFNGTSKHIEHPRAKEQLHALKKK